MPTTSTTSSWTEQRPVVSRLPVTVTGLRGSVCPQAMETERPSMLPVGAGLSQADVAEWVRVGASPDLFLHAARRPARRRGRSVHPAGSRSAPAGRRPVPRPGHPLRSSPPLAPRKSAAPAGGRSPPARSTGVALDAGPPGQLSPTPGPGGPRSARAHIPGEALRAQSPPPGRRQIRRAPVAPRRRRRGAAWAPLERRIERLAELQGRPQADLQRCAPPLETPGVQRGPREDDEDGQQGATQAPHRHRPARHHPALARPPARVQTIPAT